MAESPTFPRLKGNRGRGTRWWRQILDRKWKNGRLGHAQEKIRHKTLIYGEISAFYWKSGSGNTMMMSDFRPGVEIWLFRACAVNTQYNPCYMNNLVVVQLLWGRYHVPQNVFLVRWKINWKRPKIAEISPFTRKSGSRSQTPMSEFCYRNPLNKHLCACTVKTKQEVATNAAKSPKYQSLHAKFRTLLLTITDVDFGTYSHI